MSGCDNAGAFLGAYRREKKAPLLKRVGSVFATPTGGPFGGLRVKFDENDKALLAGLQSGGTSVLVGGMSTGTADQLFRALRVASVEDYLDRADALPFVVDDLLIYFDDARAAAGFEVLGHLTGKTIEGSPVHRRLCMGSILEERKAD